MSDSGDDDGRVVHFPGDTPMPELPGLAGPDDGVGEWNAALSDVVPRPRAWLLGNSFCRRFLSSLIADGGTGKTALRYAQAMSLATGRMLTGEHVFQRCRVLIVSLEDDAEELERRIMAVRLHYGIKRSELDGWLWLSAPGADKGKLMSSDMRGQVRLGQLHDRLEISIKKRNIDFVMLDPFVKAHSVPENDNSGMDRVAQLLSNLAARHDIAVDAPHHVSKGSADPGNAQRGRGSSSLVDAMRLAFTLSPMSQDEAKLYNIPEEERRSYVRLDKAKLNLVKMSGPAKWFKLVGVRLDNGNALYPNGDEIQTCEVWLPPDTWGDLGEEVLNRILTEIEMGLPDRNFYTIAPKGGTRSAWLAVTKIAPHKSEQQAREIIRAWVESGLLYEADYRNPVTRKDVKGLRVDNTKRPGTRCAID